MNDKTKIATRTKESLYKCQQESENLKRENPIDDPVGCCVETKRTKDAYCSILLHNFEFPNL